MKKHLSFIAAFLAAIAVVSVISSCGGGGDDVGDGTVDIEYVTLPPEATPEQLLESASGMEPVFRALIHSIGIYGGYQPSDEGFVRETVGAALFYMYGGSSPEPGAAEAVCLAAFGDDVILPSGVSAAEAQDISVAVTDVISDDSGFIAYISLMGEDGSAKDIYTANMDYLDGGDERFGFEFAITSFLRMTIGT